MTDDRERMHLNRVRWAGYAGAIWIAFQLLMLAVADGENAWGWRGLALNVLPGFVLTVGVLRGSLVAALGLGVYGVIRVLMASRVLVLIATDSIVVSHEGLIWESILVAAVALVWIVGGLSAARLRRLRS
jgi:hypothetical protein